MVFYDLYTLMAVLIITISQIVIFIKLRSGSTFLLAAGALVLSTAISGSIFIEPSRTELITMEVQKDIEIATQDSVTVGDMTKWKFYGWGPFLGSMAVPGILLWAIGMLWLALDVWRGRVANKTLNSDASETGAG